MCSSSSIDLMSISDVLQRQDEKILQNHQSLDSKIAQLQDDMRENKNTVGHKMDEIHQQSQIIMQAVYDNNQNYCTSDSLSTARIRSRVVPIQCPQQDIYRVNPAFVGDEDGRITGHENG